MNLPRPPRRTLTLADGMILIAASAVGLSIFGVVVTFVLEGRLRLEEVLKAPQTGWSTGWVIVRPVQVIAPFIPFAAAWTVTVPILRMRAPRPPARRRLAQPGVVACYAALAGVVWAAIGLAGMLAADRLGANSLESAPERWLFHFVVEELFAYIGLSVAASWVGVALAGRWRRSADWIDRFGRMLGVFWILTGLLWAVRRYLWIVPM